MALSDEKYMLLTTFRRTGEAVATPVWVVDVDNGEVAFWTSSGSGKAKRLAHTARVTVQPCDSRGRVKSDTAPIEATARIVDGAELEKIRERVVAKYGFATKITKALGTIFGIVRGKRIPYGDRGVVVTPTAKSARTTATARASPFAELADDRQGGEDPKGGEHRDTDPFGSAHAADNASDANDEHCGANEQQPPIDWLSRSCAHRRSLSVKPQGASTDLGVLGLLGRIVRWDGCSSATTRGRPRRGRL
jgi:PPOX class probable F420-dependent enzyme